MMTYNAMGPVLYTQLHLPYAMTTYVSTTLRGG